MSIIFLKFVFQTRRPVYSKITNQSTISMNYSNWWICLHGIKKSQHWWIRAHPKDLIIYQKFNLNWVSSICCAYIYDIIRRLSKWLLSCLYADSSGIISLLHISCTHISYYRSWIDCINALTNAIIISVIILHLQQPYRVTWRL